MPVYNAEVIPIYMKNMPETIADSDAPSLGFTQPSIALPMDRYRLWFSSAQEPIFSDFPGSAWRGALGHSLRRLACTTGETECRRCAEYQRCHYTAIFESPLPQGAGKMTKYASVPNPYVLEPQDQIRKESDGRYTVCLQLTLIGRSRRQASLMVEAFREAAGGPRGIAGNRMKWVGVEREDPLGSGAWMAEALDPARAALRPRAIPMPPAPPEITLHFLTPLRVKRDGARVRVEDFRFSDFFINLMRRISMLTYFHTPVPHEADFRGLAEASRKLDVLSKLEWCDMGRYSFRQKASMEMGGLVGSIAIHSESLSIFWPYLWLGQWTHAGTGATMGLGQYQLQTRRDRDADANSK